MQSKLTPLRLVRLKKGLSQWHVAQLSGVAQSRISLIENRLVVPKADEIKRISKTLGIRPDEIWQAETQELNAQ